MSAKTYEYAVSKIGGILAVTETVSYRPGWFDRLCGYKPSVTISRFFRHSFYWFTESGDKVSTSRWLKLARLVDEHNAREALKRAIPPEQDITGDKFNPLAGK